MSIGFKSLKKYPFFCVGSRTKEKLLELGIKIEACEKSAKNLVIKIFPNQQFDYIEPRDGDVMYTEAKVDKFKKHGWKSSVKLNDGLRDVFQRVKHEHFS